MVFNLKDLHESKKKDPPWKKCEGCMHLHSIIPGTSPFCGVNSKFWNAPSCPYKAAPNRLNDPDYQDRFWEGMSDHE